MQSALTMEFCAIDEIHTDAALPQMEKYIPSMEELASIKKFAERHNEPGIVKLFCDGRAYVACSKTYNYQDGSEPEICIFFNAEVVSSDNTEHSNDQPSFIISLHFDTQSLIVKVPIRHAYCHHILWHEEIDDIMDLVEEAEDLIINFLENPDEDDEYEVHIY